MPTNQFMAGVAPDPLPWLTARFADYGVYDPDISDVVRMSRILGVAQSTVNALSDGKQSYRVKFTAEHGSAYTDGKTHQVVIGTAPALDRDLTDGQRAAILIAMAAHEVGHVRWSVTMQDRLEKHYEADHFKSQWAARVFNIAHDIHLEHWMRQDFRVLNDILDLKGLYFCTPWQFVATRNVERYGALINATLYPHATDWTASPEAEAFKRFADQWAAKCREKSARRFKGLIELIEEALDYLDYRTSADVPPKDGGGTSSVPKPRPEPDEEPDDDGGCTFGPGVPEWDDEDDEGDDEDGDGAGEGDDEDDESEGTSSGGDTDEDDDEWREPEDGSGAAPRHQKGETVEPEGDDEDEDPDEGDESGDITDGESEESRPSSNPPEHESDEDDGDGEDEYERWDDSDVFREGLDEDTESAKVTDGPPLPSLHGEMHTADDADWQDEIDVFERTQAAAKDRFVVGGGPVFAKREMRVIRIQK